MTLSPHGFAKVRDLLYSTAGLAVRETKLDFLSRRVAARMEALKIEKERDYFRYLQFSQAGDELPRLIEAVVNGETCFFRDYNQLRVFAEGLLPRLLEEKGRSRRLSVLSAGCATGEEPYTLAIILREMLDRPEDWSLRIDGIDINERSLARAGEARYLDYALRDTPTAYRSRYFNSDGPHHALGDEIRQMVRFRRVNLFSENEMSALSGYDVVFCRNVLIYFDVGSASRVVENLSALMAPGGYIFFGHAETAAKTLGHFEMVRLENSFVYRK